MKKFIIMCMALLFVAGVFADVTIGTGTSTQYYPMSTYYNYYRSATLYTSTEIGATGTITDLKWYCSTANTTTSFPIKIYWKYTNLTALTSDTWANYSTGANEIYSATHTINTTGWFNFNVTDFTYDGTQNLMILVESGSAAFVSPYVNWRYTTTATNMFARVQADGSVPTSLTASTLRPNITLVGITQATPPGICSLVAPTPSGVTGITNLPTLQWAAGTGTPTQYDIYFGETLPAEGSPTVSNHLTTSWAPGTLNWNTTYSWKIVPENAYGAPAFGDCPTWTFTTKPDPTISTFPYTTDFSTWLPANWAQYNYVYGGTPATGGSWTQDDWLNITAPVNKAAKANLYYSAQNWWLVTPPIQIPATGYELKFDLALMVWNSLSTPVTAGNQADDRFLVVISNNPDMTSPTTLMEWNNTGSPNVFDNIPATGGTYTIDLDDYVGTKYIGFYAESILDDLGDNDLMIDNVTVRETPLSGVLTVNPNPVQCGSAFIGFPENTQVTLDNTGATAFTVNTISLSDATNFQLANLPTLPLTINPADPAVPFTVIFNPTVTGALTTNLLINDTRLDSSVTVNGTGVEMLVGEICENPYLATLPVVDYAGTTAGYANDYTLSMFTGLTSTYYVGGLDWVAKVTIPEDGWLDVTLADQAGYSSQYMGMFLVNTIPSVASPAAVLAQAYAGSGTISITDAVVSAGDYYLIVDNWPSPVSIYFVLNMSFEAMPSGPVLAPNMDYPLDGAINMPSSGFAYQFSWNTGGSAPDAYNLYVAAVDDLSPTYDADEFFGIATAYEDVTSPYNPGVTYEYDARYVWTVAGYNEDYPDPVFTWPPYEFIIQGDPRITIPHYQDFGTDATPVWPLNWTQTGTSLVWDPSGTNAAGGVANEMMLTWVSGTFISRLITPPINTDGIPMFQVKFNQMYDGYGTGITAKLQYSHDLVTWYDTSWSIVGTSATVGPNIGNAVISGLSEPVTYVAWALDGNHYQVDYWYVDNVVLQVPPNHDVGVVSWDYPREVVPEGTVVTPVATVGNFGINAESFTVTCTIGTYTNTQSVTGLAFGATQQVTFPSFTPALWSAENVIVNTTLATDEASDNDTLYSALICLDLDTPALANNAQTGQFVQFNLSDPGTLNPLPNTYTGTYFMSGGDWMNGQWMGVEYDDGTLVTDNYYEIDPLTGTYLPSLGEPGQAFMGIAYDDTNAILYGVTGTSGYLYTMDPLTGVAAVGDSLWFDLGVDGQWSLANIGGLMIDIAYDNFTETLYGIDLGNDCLWIIDPATYELTFVGYFGVDLNYAQDAAFDQDNGLLFLCGYSATGALYWIDTQFGGAYQIGLLGTLGYELDGFAIPYGILTIPEPTVATTGQISWPAVEGAVHYQVLKSSDPYGTYAPYATVYGTSWTDLLFSEGKAFYQIVAVGGVRSDNRQEVRFNQPLRKAGQLGLNKRVNTGIAW